MFDNLDSWKVIALLAPIILVMLFIRRRERLAGTSSYSELTPAQKTWILLQQMPPALTAQYLMRLEVHELEAYLKSASSIRGIGLNLHEPVIREYLKNLSSPAKDSEASSSQERLGKATLAIEPNDALAAIERLWPRPQLGSAAEESASVAHKS